jgi:ABC-type phosphate transport system substrate-binding protein
LGYVGAGSLYDKNGKPNGTIWSMPIYINQQRAISPYESAKVKRGEHILTRPLYQYIINNKNPLVEDFILFELTKIGQDIIMKHGFYPINDYQLHINTLKGIL